MLIKDDFNYIWVSHLRVNPSQTTGFERNRQALVTRLLKHAVSKSENEYDVYGFNYPDISRSPNGEPHEIDLKMGYLDETMAKKDSSEPREHLVQAAQGASRLTDGYGIISESHNTTLTEQDVVNEEIYEEEEDDLPM